MPFPPHVTMPVGAAFGRPRSAMPTPHRRGIPSREGNEGRPGDSGIKMKELEILFQCDT